MSTTGDGGLAYEAAANVDITKLPLTSEEGFLLSRMLGRRLSLVDLSKEGGVPPARVKDLVESLVRKGAIVVVRGGGKRAEGPDPYRGVIFSAVDLAEAVDLSEEQKKRILFYDANVNNWTFYRLLGLKRSAQGAEVKAGYFMASREFHPDAFFRKNLGSYQARVEGIYRAMKSAYDTLSDPDKRARYDETVVMELTPEEEAELEKIADQKRKERETQQRELRTAERLKEQRLKRNPMADRIKKARDLMKQAEDAYAAGRLEEAANQARLAVTFDENESLRARAKTILVESERLRGHQLLKRLQSLLASPMDVRDMMDDINRYADQAAEIASSTADSTLLTEVASVLITLKRPVKAAKLAQQATEVDPRHGRAFEMLAEAAIIDKKWAIGLRAAERWSALDPKSARAKELVKDAKRNV